jgi:integrase
MAHVRPVARKAGKPAYEVQWRDGTARKQRTFPTKREAERFALTVENELAEGNSTATLVRNARTFESVAEEMLTASAAKLKPRTHSGYVQVYRTRVFPHLGSRRIGTITNADIEQWIAVLAATPTQRKGTPLHPNTVRHAWVAANKVFQYALKHRLISHNPATGADLPNARTVDDAPQRFLSAPEVEALATALDDRAPDGLLVRLAAYTGLRAGEIQGLQIRDVNLLRKTLSVRRTRVRTTAGWHVGTPKSEKSVRDVPLRAVLVTALRDYLDEHPHKADPTAWLWPGRHYAGGGEWRGALDWSKPLDFDSFYRNRYKPAAAEVLSIPGLRFHDLRHTAASLFAGSGMPLARVARLLGHADTATTYRLYLHFFPDDYAADMDRLDAYLAPRGTAPPLMELPAQARRA